MAGTFDGNLSSYDDAQLRCRTGTHAWVKEHWTPVSLEGRGRNVTAWDVSYECHNCSATKVTELSPGMTQLKSKITYPPGYLLATGNKFDRADFRRERVNRVVGRPRLGVVRSS